MPEKSDKSKTPQNPNTQEKKEERKYLKPVAWLGGRDLLANLKYFLLFAAFKGKLDPRDWMQPETFPFTPKNEQEGDYVEAFRNSFRDREFLESKKEFWFDYFADSGDGMTAGYAIAYLCMSDLQARLPINWDTLTAQERRERLDKDMPLAEIRSRLAAGEKPSTISKDYRGRADGEILKRLDQNANRDALIQTIEENAVGVVSISNPKATPSADCLELPRGAFLFVGGDTAYHVADFAGLGLRFQKVFDWAFQDLKKSQGLSDEDAEKTKWGEPVRRPIFAVPGNHDYYDMIDGFNRQFARPITRETRFINLTGRNLTPQLRLWPFKRFQTASYVAIKLPFDWWFWGVDSELPRVDLRQQEFFKRSYALSLEGPQLEALKEEVWENLRQEFRERSLNRQPNEDDFNRRFPRVFQTGFGNIWKMPSKLIVATSEPTTVEGRRARDEEKTQDKTPQAFSFLDLTRPFLYLKGRKNEPPNEKKDNQRAKFRAEEKGRKLRGFECRLDISGDVHHYARYWGDDSVGSAADAASSDNYASIVSGGGGASMSPTQTDYNEIEEQALYPAKEASTRIINKQLFKPWVVISGGNVWLAGAIIALIIFFGASSHKNLTDSLIDKVGAAPHHLIANGPIESAGRLMNLLLASESHHVIKLLLLLLVAGWAIIGAGLYARWLFERLTKTYDWARDQLLNLRLSSQAPPTGEDPYEKDTEAERLYKSFLLDMETADLGGKTESEIEAQYGKDAEIKALYKKFIEKTETQVNPGVPAKRRLRFVLVAILPFLFTVGLWTLEILSWQGHLSQIFHVVLLALLIILVAVSVGFTCWYSRKEFKQFKKVPLGDDPKHRATNLWRVIQLSVTPSHDYVPFWSLLLFTGAAVLSLMLWEYEYAMNEALPVLGSSAAILFSIFVAGAAAVVAIYYSKWLFDQSYRIKVNPYSYIPVMALSGVAILLLGAAISLFGRNQGRFIITDSLYLAALLAVIVGCIILAAVVGNHLPKWQRYVGFGLLGFWHGLLQLLVPFMLVWFGSGKAMLIAFGTVVVFGAISIILTHLKVDLLINRVVLPLLWLVYGFWMIAIPLLWPRDSAHWAIAPKSLIISGAFVLAGIIAVSLADLSTAMGRWTVLLAAVLTGATAWFVLKYLGAELATCLLAGLIGAVMSCVWLGWYFAVSLVFDGHANEAGSTARTEAYKQFIRFRITENTLTGFVIALDFPRAPQDGEDVPKLAPRLVDVFTLKCGPPPEPPDDLGGRRWND